jgi:hypothetical protein
MPPPNSPARAEGWCLTDSAGVPLNLEGVEPVWEAMRDHGLDTEIRIKLLTITETPTAYVEQRACGNCRHEGLRVEPIEDAFKDHTCTLTGDVVCLWGFCPHHEPEESDE